MKALVWGADVLGGQTGAAGKALFFDKSLSASAEQSCGSCHVPSRAFTADPATDRGLPVPPGGRHRDPPGFRNAPSLVYAHLTPAKPRTDFTGATWLCGVFKVPTLRNVAITAPYFHNAALPTLHQVVQFYVTRDINNNTGNNPLPVPAGPGGNPYQAVGTFYTAADGTPDLYQYNDLPAAFDANVNAGETPYTAPAFAGGNAPTLTAAEIDDLVAFLCTLTDGYDPQQPAAYNVPTQCAPGAN